MFAPIEWETMSSGGRPGRRKCELSNAALCPICCSRLNSCRRPSNQCCPGRSVHRQHQELA